METIGSRCAPGSRSLLICSRSLFPTDYESIDTCADLRGDGTCAAGYESCLESSTYASPYQQLVTTFFVDKKNVYNDKKKYFKKILLQIHVIIVISPLLL